MLKMTKKQRRGYYMLLNPNFTRILFDGGARAGKTVLWTEYVVQRALQYPGSRQLVARKCRNHAKSSLWNDTFRSYLRKNIKKDMYQLLDSEMTIRFFNDSEIIIGGLDDAEHVEKILGNEYITVVLNEATQLSYGTMQMVQTRLAQKAYDSNGQQAVPKMIVDCNPRGPRHWLYYVGVRHVDPETEKPLSDAKSWARLNWSAYDNKENLPEEFLKALESLPEVMRNRMLYGLWVSSDGLVYDEFNEEVHVIDPFEIPEDWIKIRGIDFGYTNPFVCLWGALDPDGRLYIYREIYRKNVRTAAVAQEILEKNGAERILLTVADHDAQERAELESAGIYTEPAKKYVMAGIQAVKNRLSIAGDGKPRVYFFRDLKNILSELNSYEWLPAMDGSNAKDAPKKENDHAMDALRYMIMACNEKFESSIKNMIKMCAVF